MTLIREISEYQLGRLPFEFAGVIVAKVLGFVRFALRADATAVFGF
jgi:hypothetical protein